jgi:hypothetical protein
MEIEQLKKSTTEKMNFFFEKKIKIHIIKHNREFLNGYLIEKESEDIFILEEDYKGRIYLFASEVHDIEEFIVSETLSKENKE